MGVAQEGPQGHQLQIESEAKLVLRESLEVHGDIYKPHGPF